MAFTLRQLQYFVAVAEKGTVSGAAQAMSISQSSITEAIKDLESDLGVSMFDRHPRGLAITHNGHQFLRHATNILASVSDARRSLAIKDDAMTGQLNLGVTSLVAGYVFSELLRRYRRACPAVDVTAMEDSSSYLEHLLIGGELDLAVRARPASSPAVNGSAWRWLVLSSTSQKCCCWTSRLAHLI
ncbi:LysR family transcriptional regulator [Agrobacterium vitis]|nr:LysR family transcriptional regulator [Agrobacterium vitis]MUO73081.1 LysR family transcriptional regulator [Agrobacterium vitis]MUO86266.1 LysR family transcriptional regulator [Agrobacterium vitis]